MELALPQHYTMLDELETHNLNGGSWERAALYGAVIAGSIALGAALVYGQYWLAARMLGHSVRYVVRKHGINSVMRVIAAASGVSMGVAWKFLDYIT
ncbi:hypothetical protein [Erysipelothrix aquatica]|uniref:hypothetical protein n=1 Tax=Erysipelothrix aquatica TaxID=2683714 RepID=UPI001357D189|nr:hypothetical protein [Erysipelothrix aquatica]